MPAEAGGRECKLSLVQFVGSELAPESGEKQQSRLAGQQLPPGPLGLLQLLTGERVCCCCCCPLIHQQQQSEASGWGTAEAGLEEQVEKAAKMGRREGRFPGAPSRAGREGRRTTERIASSALPVPTTSPAMEAAKGVERGIRAFNNIAGEEQVREFISSDIVCFVAKTC